MEQNYRSQGGEGSEGWEENIYAYMPSPWDTDNSVVKMWGGVWAGWRGPRVRRNGGHL